MFLRVFWTFFTILRVNTNEITIFIDGKFLVFPCFKMADADSENELSDDEILDDVGQFDLIDINNAERRELERQWQEIVGDSDDEAEFLGFEVNDELIIKFKCY